MSETALGRKKWYPYLRESAFRDVSRHSFISRMKGPWESDYCKSYWEVWRDKRPVHGSDFMRISISFFFLSCLAAHVHDLPSFFFFLQYMYWWTYSRLAALETLSPLLFASLHRFFVRCCCFISFSSLWTPVSFASMTRYSGLFDETKLWSYKSSSIQKADYLFLPFLFLKYRGVYRVIYSRCCVQWSLEVLIDSVPLPALYPVANTA